MPRGSRPGERRGGRQKGSKNKTPLDLKKQLAAQRAEARAKAAIQSRALAQTQAQLDQLVEDAKSQKMPLDVMLEFMRDENNPPGFRGDMAKAAAIYCHSRAPEAQPDRIVQITEIRRVIIEPPVQNFVDRDSESFPTSPGASPVQGRLGRPGQR